MKKIKKYFITGLIAILPLFLTIFILLRILENIVLSLNTFLPIQLVVSLIDKLPLSSLYLKESLSYFIVYIFSFILIYVLLVVIGVIVSHFIDEKKVKWIENIFLKIPLAKPIYSTLKQISDVLFSKNISSYKKVVMLEYPRKGIYSLGFLTNDDNEYFKKILSDVGQKIDAKEKMVNIFIPTSPNPTSGMFVSVKKREVIELNLKVEDAIKLIISGGAIMPK
ncbi:DUF502 domain-containing protein [Haliovirga abyssi]|uniref:Membrane protein n=1 Tax=Haliovirga abyssi TaxID=2996794 RepID=A0AAU9DVI8_9FUSO|nr:DUF502 domain-containing protein [Haliovirga abyssi]BDU50191.1 membrane protein [Haliovirga abyssi]